MGLLTTIKLPVSWCEVGAAVASIAVGKERRDDARGVVDGDHRRLPGQDCTCGTERTEKVLDREHGDCVVCAVQMVSAVVRSVETL